MALNKTDLLTTSDPADRHIIAPAMSMENDAVFVSALRGDGIEDLLRSIDLHLVSTELPLTAAL